LKTGLWKQIKILGSSPNLELYSVNTMQHRNKSLFYNHHGAEINQAAVSVPTRNIALTIVIMTKYNIRATAGWPTKIDPFAYCAKPCSRSVGAASHARRCALRIAHACICREQEIIEWSGRVNSMIASCNSGKLCSLASRLSDHGIGELDSNPVLSEDNTGF